MSIVVLALGRVYRSINSKLFLAPIGRIVTTCSAYNMIVVRAFSCSEDF
jgi:putative component of membrane protein insertase Oxa1/YidC/SpoIIIJ protein YidD